MNITFVTTQNLTGSTLIGRVLPLALRLARRHQVHLLIHATPGLTPISLPSLTTHVVGANPFHITPEGKQRLGGFQLILRLARNTFQTFRTLTAINPEVVAVVKALPQNVAASWAWAKLQHQPKKILLDVDDFELTANVLTSLMQRASIHAAERVGARQATTIIAATPFLQDHFTQLTQGKKKIYMIPTGAALPSYTQTKPPKNPTLLYAGSISIKSGHRVDLLPDILSSVLKEIPNAQLIIAGSGDDKHHLQQEFKQRNLEAATKWHDRFTKADLAQLLPTTTVLLDPIDASIANRAKSSFRVMLAAQTGIPIVTSNIGLRPYLLPQKLHGRFFAQPENPQEYAEKIMALCTQPLTDEEQRSMKTHAQQYTLNSLAEEYEAQINAA